jgi:hypothetical protein
MTPLIIHVDFRAIGRTGSRSASIDHRRKDADERRAGTGKPAATAMIIRLRAMRDRILKTSIDPGAARAPDDHREHASSIQWLEPGVES